MIRDRSTLAATPARETALDCVAAGIEAARPDRALARACTLDGDALSVGGRTYDLADYDEVLVLGGGKAAAGLARGLVDLLGDRLDGGVVVVPDAPGDPGPVDATVGGHPVPDEGSVSGARRVLDSLARVDERTLVLAPVTGGGSALLAAPAAGVSLGDLRETTRALLDAGASIGEVNAVRKHLSAVKGGRLARAAAPATVAVLLVSDVVGDDPSVIASGPFSPDETTYGDALAVLDRYGLDVPDAVRDRLERGAAGECPETPGPGEAAFARIDHHVLSNARTAIDAAREAARERGYATLVLSSRIEGEAREVGRFHAAVATEALATGDPLDPPAVVLSGGEATVTVRGDGTGGPNLEAALAAALDLPGDTALASVDTDGRDGSTDAAGGLVDADSVPDGGRGGARDALAANDALTYLDDRNGVIRTGPTGTNVNDLRVLVVGEPPT